MAANLTDIAIKTRKTVKLGIFFIIFVAFLNLSWKMFLRIKPILFPEPPPPPTVGFQVLKPIPFPKNSEPLPDFEYTIETASGGLPQFPADLPVYFMPGASATLDSVSTANHKAAALGFTIGPIADTQTLYKYKRVQVPATLEMNIVNGNFSISYNLAADSTPINFPAPDAKTAAALAKGFLSKAESLPEDLTVTGQPQYLKVEGQNLVNALSLSDADFTRINFYKKAQGENGEYPSLTPHKDESNIWFIISGANEAAKQVIAAEYKYFAIDETLLETYPVKTAAQALKDLKDGKGYIANLGLNKDGQITIRKIYIAYYDPDRATNYYQPIIVFEGDREFLAYVPAVTSDFYSEE